MKALVYHGPNTKAWEEKPKPSIIDATDAVVKIIKTTELIRAEGGVSLRASACLWFKRLWLHWFF